VHLHPQDGEIFRRNLQGKFVVHPQHTKCTPGQSKSQFLGHSLLGRGDLEVGVVHSVVKKVVNFFEEKSAPPDNILVTPMSTGAVPQLGNL